MGNKKEINHWCVLCGIGYHSCDTCSKEKHFTPWRALTDTMEHYKIFMVLKDYNNKLTSKEEARELLADLNLSGQDSFKESAKNLLADIFSKTGIEASADKNENTAQKKKSRKSMKSNEETQTAEKESIFFETAE